MVYCGKPSKACRHCRRRNIKCDKKKDSCGQCIRAGLECPGYRDPNALVFRDETMATVHKASKKYSPAFPIYAPLFPIPDIEERAKVVFVSHHVRRTSSETPMFDYMAQYYPGTPSNVHLGITIRAVSLAYLANELFAPEILQKARRRYSSALLLTNKALQCPQTATENTTLLTVLLLHLFERFANKHEPPIDCKHMEGAIALVKLRGCDQFRDDVGLRMFHQLNSNILTRCLERDVEVPLDLLTLRSHASQHVDTQDRQWRLSELLIRFIGIRAAMKSGEISALSAAIAVSELDIENVECGMIIGQNWTFSDVISGAIPVATLAASLVEARTSIIPAIRDREMVEEVNG